PDAAARVGSCIATEGSVENLQWPRPVADAASVKAGRIAAQRAINHHSYGTAVKTGSKDGTAICVNGRVAAERAVKHHQRPEIVDAAGPVNGGVAAQGAVGYGQRRVATGATVVVNAAAVEPGRVASDGAAVNHQCRVVVIDAAAIAAGRAI